MNLVSRIILIVNSLLLIGPLNAQEITLSTLLNTDEAFQSFTLFAPFNNFNTYLVNNCGELINVWESQERLAAAVYLTEEAELVRTYKQPSGFFGGGSGGGIEIFNWDGDRIWFFEYANDNYALHHDIEVLPNGNILAIAWEYKTIDEAISLGKVGVLPQDGMWPDHIIEIQRGGSNDKEIVWSWHAWDHLVQDVDPNIANYGQINENPGRININIFSNESDWIHFNSIDYHEDLDQIILSSRHFSEIWVIDHSTTTEEAANSEGGNYGKGGDILYRWGNPIAYKAGNQSDRQLFGQHDAEWILPQLNNGDQIMLFNNGIDRSSIEILTSPINEHGFYMSPQGSAYLPESTSWSYDGGMNEFFFSASVSGCSQLENGNFLIISGEEGRIFEVGPSGDLVWDYIVPVGGAIFAQGDQPFLNQLFKAEKYSIHDERFEGLNVTSQGPLEINPVPNSCELISKSIDVEINDHRVMTKENWLTIEMSAQEIYQVKVFNLSSQVLMQSQFQDKISEDLSHLPGGVYIITVEKDGQVIIAEKIFL